jgi:hypothetical protein
MGHFKKFKAYEHARRLVIISKPLIDRLPSAERSGLADQWRRASQSVALNIAEGASRPGRNFGATWESPVLHSTRSKRFSTS